MVNSEWQAAPTKGFSSAGGGSAWEGDSSEGPGVRLGDGRQDLMEGSWVLLVLVIAIRVVTYLM